MNGAPTARSSTRTVTELWPVTNAWDEDAQVAMAQVEENAITSSNSDKVEHPLTTQRRYWIDPKDMLKAQKHARNNGLSIVGIYHSHPDHPAVPSECDRACAWPEYSYIIASVPNGQATDVLSWALDHDHQFQAEAVDVSP